MEGFNIDFERVADKDAASTLLSAGAGIITARCVSTLVTDIIDEVAPTPDTIGLKITYGIAGHAIGWYSGVKVSDAVEENVKKACGLIATLKSFNNTFNQEQKQEN